MALRKITDQDLQGYGVIGMADTPNLSAREMQEKVEEVVRSVVIPVMNQNIDNTVSVQDLAEVVLKSGAGDMLTLGYDSNKDGIVNMADNGFFTYTHSKEENVHYLAGSGDNVKFIATADFEDGDTFMIDGNNYSPFLINGDALTGGHFKTGYVVSCFRNGDCLNFNGGGVELNFKVVGGTPEPASPKENTIWVKTSVEITAWALDGNEPDYLPEGGVWIEIGTAGNTLFNTLKKNHLLIAPKRAWQWIGGDFVEKKMLIYQDGEWKKAEQTLFPYGLDFVTGGENRDNCEAGDTYLRCEAKPTSTNGNCHSLTVIDCRDYTKLTFTVASVTLPGNATATVGVHYSGAGTTSGGYTAYADVTAPGVYEVDITDVEYKLYVTVSVWSSDAEPQMTVTGIVAV